MKTWRKALPQKQNDTGFTLIEVLVSFALLALILAAIPSAIHLGRRAVSTATGIERTTAEVTNMSFIERRMSESITIFEHSPDGLLTIAFKGDHSSVSFVAPMAVDDERSGNFLFTLSELVPSDGTRHVVLAWQPFRSNNKRIDVAALREQQIVIARCEKFGLRYFGTHAFGAAPEWEDTWTRSNALPSMVEISYVVGRRVMTRTINLQLAGPQ